MTGTERKDQGDVSRREPKKSRSGPESHDLSPARTPNYQASPICPIQTVTFVVFRGNSVAGEKCRPDLQGVADRGDSLPSRVYTERLPPFKAFAGFAPS